MRVRYTLGLTVLVVAIVSVVRIRAQQPDGLRLIRERTSMLGTHTWYQQTHRGVDVLDGVYGRHFYQTGDALEHDQRRSISRPVDVTPSISAAGAARAAGQPV